MSSKFSDYDDYECYDEEDYTEEDDDYWDDDYCYECAGYGDDYFINDDGELECRCFKCPFNPFIDDDDDWDY